MTPEEKIAIMTKAINAAIKVMEHPFESTQGDVARVVEGLRNSLLKEPLTPATKPA